MLPWQTLHAGQPSIGEFAQPSIPISGRTLCPDVDRVFSLNPGLNSIVVQTGDGDYFILDRHEFVHHMTGAYGFGRMLYQRTEIERFINPSATLALPPETTILEANNALFARGESFRQHDIVVMGLAPTGVGVLSTVVLLREAAHLHAKHALHDQLTALPNRSMVIERLNQLLRLHGTHRTGTLALLFLDLDRFKNINDSLGHDAGDSLLVAFGNRLAKTVGEGELAARLGGDEFAVVLEQAVDEAAVTAVAERILHSLGQPLTFDGADSTVGASIGVAIASEEDDTGTLLRKADIAMYRAKNAGGNRYAVFQGTLGDEGRKRMDIEAQLRQAVVADELVVHYQPIIDCASGGVLGMEALVRWQHPRRGLLQPGSFLPVAIETGLISKIDRWVLRRSCAQLAEWRSRPGTSQSAFVSVNVSSQQLEREDMVEDILATLSEYGLPAKCLQIEITESSLITSLRASAEHLKRLKAAGIRIALDDFGTGYSSLNHLRHFPFDVLKIDRAFVTEASERQEDAAVIKLVVALAAAMNGTVTAEGVEREEEATLLRSIGCGQAQGFLYGRPVSAEEAAALVVNGAMVSAGRAA